MKTIHAIIRLMRPHQWLKNLLLFFPPFYGGALFHASIWASALPAFISFGCVASCCYILNDIVDRDADRLHPKKKNRPIASGKVSIVFALLIALMLYVFAMMISSSLPQRFIGYLIMYMFLTFTYSLSFKHIIFADIIAIAFGFVIRVLAGGEVFSIPVTRWLSLTVFLVAIVLAAGKRLGEYAEQGDAAGMHRKILLRYSPQRLIVISRVFAIASIVTYTLYCMNNRPRLLASVPIAIYGFARYISIAREGRGDPTDALLKDRKLMLTGIVWAAAVGYGVYG